MVTFHQETENQHQPCNSTTTFAIVNNEMSLSSSQQDEVRYIVSTLAIVEENRHSIFDHPPTTTTLSSESANCITSSAAAVVVQEATVELVTDELETTLDAPATSPRGRVTNDDKRIFSNQQMGNHHLDMDAIVECDATQQQDSHQSDDHQDQVETGFTAPPADKLIIQPQEPTTSTRTKFDN